MILSGGNASTCSHLNQRLLPKLLLGHSDPSLCSEFQKKHAAEERERNALLCVWSHSFYMIGCKN